MTLRTLVAIVGFVIFLNLSALTIMLMINIKEIRKIRIYLKNEQDEKDIIEAMKDYEEDIEVL